MTLEEQMIAAAEAGRTADVEAALKSGADVHALDDLALCEATEHGHTETVKALLAGGADVHALGEEALRIAAEHGDAATVKVLLEAGADPREDDHKAYWGAVAWGAVEVVNLLRERIGYEPRPPGEERILSEPPREKLSERFSRVIRDRNFGAHSEDKGVEREPDKGRERK